MSCKEIIENQHGMINKYLGDGFLTYWRGSRLRVRRRLSRSFPRLKELQRKQGRRFGFVVHFGAVAIGGVASMGEESLMGGEVNLVFRLEKLAGSLGEPCCVSETAQTKLHGLVAHGRLANLS